MTKMTDLMDPAELFDMLEAGYVRVREHPDDPEYRIFNYTEKAVYERVWNDVTRQCRGLIVHGDEVIARPWPKFFNYGEHEEGTFDLEQRVVVTDKLDGSLGILYKGPNGWAIATRGSFESEQAIHATQVLHQRYMPDEQWHPYPGDTYLFEIIYPGNRIVVDYGATDDLYLLGMVSERSTVKVWTASQVYEWHGPRTKTLAYKTLSDALAAPPRPNAEGVVVYLGGSENRTMVKIKQEDYVQLHRLVTGLTEKRVWEWMVEHNYTHAGLLSQIPEEFWGWVENVALALQRKVGELIVRAHEVHLDAVSSTIGGTRKDYAMHVKSSRHPEVAKYAFMLLDGKDVRPAVWKAVKPSGAVSMLQRTEDVA